MRASIRRSSRGVATRSALVAASLTVGGALAVRAQMSDRQARVEVNCPAPPTAVKTTDGRFSLVYELHVTNMGPGALSIRQIDVFDATQPRRDTGPVASYHDTTLTAALGTPGMMGRASTRLDPGQQAIAYLWLGFAPDARVPRSLRHRITFDIVDSALARRDRGTEDAIDDVLVDVSPDRPVRVRTPFDHGTWLGGSGPSNESSHRRSLNAVDGHGYLAERFAADWQMIGPNGNTYQGDEHRNASYWSYGQPVHSVAAGEVVVIVDSIADNTPHAPLPRITLANIGGNYVIVRIGPNRYATYAHLKPGSIRVHLRQQVVAGEVLAEVGNTGQATAPHLHMQITDRPSMLAAEGLPFVFSAFVYEGSGQNWEPDKHPAEPRADQLPMGDAVIGVAAVRAPL